MSNRQYTAALNIIDDHAEGELDHQMVGLALEYLHACVPPDTTTHEQLAKLTEVIELLPTAKKDGSDAELTPLTRHYVNLLRHCIRELPTVPTMRTREQWAQLAATLGVRHDWHEPGNQNVTVVQTGGELDNTGSAVLEQTLVVWVKNVPVAQVNLATLCALASVAETPTTRACPSTPPDPDTLLTASPQLADILALVAAHRIERDTQGSYRDVDPGDNHDASHLRLLSECWDAGLIDADSHDTIWTPVSLTKAGRWALARPGPLTTQGAAPQS